MQSRPGFRVGVLTVSDSRSAGAAADTAGPSVLQAVQSKLGCREYHVATVPDVVEDIRHMLRDWTDRLDLDLILTVGGTGFGPRDVTPEACRAEIERDAPGLVVAMLQAGLRVTPYAMLSRPVAGTRRSTLIVNLPGSPTAAVENFEAIATALPHALAHLRQTPEASEHRAPGAARPHS
jgi:gephyrin